MQEGWCWRAAELRSQGILAPDDPRQCLSPRPAITERAEEVLDIVSLARRQLRIGGMGGVIGLDWNAVARLADDSGQETDRWWWTLLSTVEAILVEACTPKTVKATEE